MKQRAAEGARPGGDALDVDAAKPFNHGLRIAQVGLPPAIKVFAGVVENVGVVTIVLVA